MSDRVTLVPRSLPDEPYDLDAVRPDRFAELTEREISTLPLWVGRQRHELGELFEVSGERSSTVHVAGDLSRANALAAGMTHGTLTVDGDVGRGLGRAMSGGVIRIHGNAGDEVGSASPGASRGMNGGEIIVRGSVGATAGACARRGLIVVEGDAGPGAAHGMIAGTVIVSGNVAGDAGPWNKRGSLIVLGDVTIPASYRYACTYRPAFAALLLRSVRARHELRIPDQAIGGLFRRYSGDLAEVGKGEILHWVRQ